MIKLGVIGLSEGNGHPYSWSAICNGYNAEAMEDCGFSAIPRYLAERQWPNDRLPGVKVTHVWAQDSDRAAHIARAALIDHVAARPEEMIGEIDGLLLARDDAENNLTFATPFLEAGVPVYIDKVPSLSVSDFDRLCDKQKRTGLIFTGTALRFAKEFMLDAASRDELGVIRYVFGVTPKSWDRYAVHVIEPALSLLGVPALASANRVWPESIAQGLDVRFADGTLAHFVALGDVATPITLRVIGEKATRDLVFADAFGCFRTALAEFVSGIRENASRSDLIFARRVVELLEAGRR